MGLLFLAFVVLPLADLWLLVRIGGVIGGPNALTFTLAMGLLGALLVRNQGRKVLGELREAQAEGRVPEEGVVGGLLVLAGGLLLITPGVITDALGLVCLFPPTRRAIGRALAQGLARKIAGSQLRVQVQDFGAVWSSDPGSHAAEPRASTRPPSSSYTAPGATRIPRDARARRVPRPEDVIDTEGEEL